MRPLVITYHTGGAYAVMTRALVSSCDRFGLESEVYAMPNLGSWERNCAQKPSVIRTAMERHENRLLIWVDADAEFVADLPTCPEGCDIGVFRNRDGRHCSGTVVVWPTPAARVWIKRWCVLQARDLGRLDEETMADAVFDCPDLTTWALPPSLIYVFDLWPNRYPSAKAVILHKQASRADVSKARTRYRPHPEIAEIMACHTPSTSSPRTPPS